MKMEQGSRRMKVLVSGFEPFGQESVNPAWEAVQALPDLLEGMDVVKCQVPTAFCRAFPVLQTLLEQEQPDAVVCVGQAGGRSVISVEQVAINLREARIADNDGFQPQDVPILPTGPAAYFSTLPVLAMVEAIRQAGIPAAVSYTAGTFVCNDLMYQLLQALDQKERRIPGGFIHVPYLPVQAVHHPTGTPSMALEEIQRGLCAALSTLASSLQNESGLEFAKGSSGYPECQD